MWEHINGNNAIIANVVHLWKPQLSKYLRTSQNGIFFQQGDQHVNGQKPKIGRLTYIEKENFLISQQSEISELRSVSISGKIIMMLITPLFLVQHFMKNTFIFNHLMLQKQVQTLPSALTKILYLKFSTHFFTCYSLVFYKLISTTFCKNFVLSNN